MYPIRFWGSLMCPKMRIRLMMVPASPRAGAGTGHVVEHLVGCLALVVRAQSLLVKDLLDLVLASSDRRSIQCLSSGDPAGDDSPPLQGSNPFFRVDLGQVDDGLDRRSHLSRKVKDF
jgi:hypothetical protein